MNLRRLYLFFFLFVYALYCFFNKGVAYLYLAEICWVFGLALVIRERKSFEFVWDKRLMLISIMLAITLLYMIRGMMRYPILDVIRDSFMLNYVYFIFIIFLLRKELPELKKGLYIIYTWFPVVAASGFLLRTFIPSLNELILFGNIPFLAYKNGDMSVHLLITTLLIINGKIKIGRRFMALNIVLIAYLFLISATFNRGGMLAFLTGFGLFFFYLRKTALARQFFTYLKVLPIVIIVALPLYVSTNVEDSIQGRSTSIGQLKDNVKSIVNHDMEGSMNANVLWRLVWWAKIIDYTVLGDYFLFGKGVGVNLAIDDDIKMEDDSLRSPHNFHLNILARFGVPFFLLWLYWLWLMIRKVREKGVSQEVLSYLCIFIAFLVNASFDVALEGPMAAFPCWVFVGLWFADEGFGSLGQEEDVQKNLQSDRGTAKLSASDD